MIGIFGIDFADRLIPLRLVGDWLHSIAAPVSRDAPLVIAYARRRDHGQVNEVYTQ